MGFVIRLTKHMNSGKHITKPTLCRLNINLSLNSVYNKVHNSIQCTCPIGISQSSVVNEEVKKTGDGIPPLFAEE